MTNLTLPGLIDAHVHLREPGETHKEDVTSGTVAALAGGFVGVLDMPNNAPPITDRHTLDTKLSIFRAKAVSDYGLFIGFDGEHVAATAEAAPAAVGLKLYLDETFGDMTTREPARLAEVFEAWPGPGPIAVHAESPSIRVALRLAERYGRRLHVVHTPHPDDLLYIDAARQRGVAVTCEVTPHHLFLSDEAVTRLGAFAHMKPPLLSAELVALFWQRLHLVDAIASDHAPHTREEKGPIPYHQDTKGTQGEPADSGGRTADSEGRTADSERRTADSEGRTADSGGRTADSGGRTRRSAPTPRDDAGADQRPPIAPHAVKADQRPPIPPHAVGADQRPPIAPHAVGADLRVRPVPGVPGLETTLPLLLHAVDEGRLSLERVIDLLHHNPLRIYGLRAPADTAVEVELGAPYRLPFDGYHTRCGWSPFVGQLALGRVARVQLRGATVFEDGRVLVEPGYGRALERV